MLQTPVSAVMAPVPEPLPESCPLLQAAERLGDIAEAILPVVDDRSSYRGVITDRLVADILTTRDGVSKTVGDATENAPSVRSTQTLEAVIDLVDRVGTAVVPVLDEQGSQLVGWSPRPGCWVPLQPANGKLHAV